MTKTNKFLFLIILMVLSVSFLKFALADIGGGPSLINPLCAEGDAGCTRTDAAGVLKSIIDWLIQPGGIATILAVGMILVGAFQIMFAGGDPEKFKNGRKTILYTVIGYAIILIGWGLTSIIQDILSK